MKTIEVVIGDRIYLEILPDELEPVVDSEDEVSRSSVVVVDMVPDVYNR